MNNEQIKLLQEELDKGVSPAALELPKDASIDVISYTITIQADRYYYLTDLLKANKSITPEIIGFILGLARPKYVIKMPAEKK